MKIVPENLAQFTWKGKRKEKKKVIFLQKLIDAALRGVFLWYQCYFSALSSKVQLERNFAFLIQVEELNGNSASSLHFLSFDSTPALANGKKKVCFQFS